MQLTLPSLQLLQIDRPVERRARSCGCEEGKEASSSYEGTERRSTLLDFVERSNCPLSDLQLNGLKMSDVQLLTLLHLVPHLTRLSVTPPPAFLSQLLTKDDTEGTPAICPKLQSLTLVGCHVNHATRMRAAAHHQGRLTARRQSVVAEKKPLIGRSLRELCIQGCARTRDSAEEVAKMMPICTVSFLEDDKGMYTYGPGVYT
ncbi:hypothetical protein HYDPIDRAFT_109479 [Hydnomerulius pinastri MD-312]|nr:hypothetical protein HYDPIDRAFT_109479 [Hydnomerulius pinastri MD-312]